MRRIANISPSYLADWQLLDEEREGVESPGEKLTLESLGAALARCLQI